MRAWLCRSNLICISPSFWSPPILICLRDGGTDSEAQGVMVAIQHLVSSRSDIGQSLIGTKNDDGGQMWKGGRLKESAIHFELCWVYLTFLSSIAMAAHQ